MLSQAVINAMASGVIPHSITLVNGSNLFAEASQGSTYVLARTIVEKDAIRGVSAVRSAYMQLLVSGWATQEMKDLAEACLATVEDLPGRSIADNAEIFTVLSVEVTSRPVMIKYLESRAFTARFEVHYRIN